MANTFELISAVTVGSGGAASIDFTSIPAIYTDLVIKFSARNTIADLDILIKFNGLTTSFTSKRLYGDGNTVGTDSLARTAGLIAQSSDTGSTFSNNEIYIPNYAGSTNKSYSVDSVTENNATTSYQLFGAGLWSNTSAITSITLATGATNVTQYSTAYLYGIKNS